MRVCRAVTRVKSFALQQSGQQDLRLLLILLYSNANPVISNLALLDHAHCLVIVIVAVIQRGFGVERMAVPTHPPLQASEPDSFLDNSQRIATQAACDGGFIYLWRLVVRDAHVKSLTRVAQVLGRQDAALLSDQQGSAVRVTADVVGADGKVGDLETCTSTNVSRSYRR